MPSYSVMLTTGFRADCQGKRISAAMKSLAEKRPDLIEVMTSGFITYINGVSDYGFRHTEESRKALESIKSGRITKDTRVWAEMARRKVAFHNGENWNEIKLWGLFDWKYVEKYLKSGELLAPGYTKENKTIWVRPSQKAWEEKIKPLIETNTLNELTKLAGWYLDTM